MVNENAFFNTPLVNSPLNKKSAGTVSIGIYKKPGAPSVKSPRLEQYAEKLMEPR